MSMFKSVADRLGFPHSSSSNSISSHSSSSSPHNSPPPHRSIFSSSSSNSTRSPSRQHQRNNNNHNHTLAPPLSSSPSLASYHFGQRKTSVSTPKPILPPLTFLHNNNDTLAQSVASAGGDSSELGPSKAENVTVTVRVRPFSNVDLRVKGGPEQVWALHEASRITYADEYSMAGRRAAVEYAYDHALTGSDNEIIYSTSVKSLVQSAMEGYNGTVFAYGQTSSGKTYTMSGTQQEPGITPRAVDDVFKHIQENPDREFLLRVSYIEIYNESIRDLLSPEAIDLRIHEDRRVNEASCVRLLIEEYMSVLLAGSEKASADMERRKEGAFINKSLLTLGTVIAKLTEEKGAHIPYRDSKLTRILQSSLSGNARVSVICTISPSFVNVEESHNTLKFAARVKKVVTKAHTNQVLDDKALLEKYRREIGELKAQLLLTASASSSGPNGGLSSEADKGAHAELSTLLERERLKHEEEISEMNFIRNALKERIDHLTKLILTSQSINAKPGPTAYRLSKRYTVETSADGTVLEFPKEIESRLARKDTIVRQLQSELELQQEKVNVMKQALQRTAKGEVVDIERTLAKLEMEPREKDRFLIEKRASIMSMNGLYTQGATSAQTKEMEEKIAFATMSPTALSTESQSSPVQDPDEDTKSLLNLESERLAIDDESEDEDLMDTPWNRAELQSLRQAKRELEIVVIDQEKKLEEMSVVASFSALEDSEEFKSLVLELEEHKERILGMEEERESLKAAVTELRNAVRRLELDQAQKEETRQQQQAMMSLASVGGMKTSSKLASPKSRSSSSPSSTSSLSSARIQELEQMLNKERKLRMDEQNRSMARIASLEADLTIMKVENSVRGLE
ncbi:hypothetical protein MVEG_00767 [Podila verticillata NRRL 6337]|nr:hypothetical protein MVEG_00767 [Podila verticillata NRRL 6337]